MGSMVTSPGPDLRDTLGRPLRNLRVSVTDRCNLRCEYCMPEEEYAWLPRDGPPRPSRRSARSSTCSPTSASTRCGSPAASRCSAATCPTLVRLLAGQARAPGPGDDDQRRPPRRRRPGALKAAGLHRVTVSLDTLRPDRFRRAHATRRARRRARAASTPSRPRDSSGLKLDTVVIRGVNDDELVDLVEFARRDRRRGALHRVHGRRRRDALVARAGGVARGDARAPERAVTGRSSRSASAASAPAERFRLGDGTTFGIIASTTTPFCRTCDREPAHGGRHLVPVPLRAARDRPARPAARTAPRARSSQALIAGGWTRRRDRGAEERARDDRAPRGARPDRGAPAGPASRDAHSGRLSRPART